jgi:hypothetical protein
MPTQSSELQCFAPKKEIADEMQDTFAATAVPVLMMQDLSISCSSDNQLEGGCDEYDMAFTYHPDIANQNRVVMTSTLDTRSTRDAKKNQSKKNMSDRSHPSTAAQDQQPIPHHLTNHEQPISICCADDTQYDPIRILRRVRGAPPPPPRRFYASQWSTVVRAACAAERAVRLARARSGDAD